MSNIKIELSQNHRDKWKYLMAKYFDFYHFPYDVEKLDSIFEKIRSNKIYSYVALYDDQVVGIANFIIHDSTFSDLACYLSDLFVDNEYRKMGIARLLIDKVINFAKQHNCKKVYWSTLPDNKEARNLYDKICSSHEEVIYEKLI